MKVKEWRGDVVFLHEVAHERSRRSYGIHVGRLAGLPDSVVRRAAEVLTALERENQDSAVNRLADGPLFQASPQIPGSIRPSALEAALDAITDKSQPRGGFGVSLQAQENIG